MRTSRFTEARIIGMIKEQGSGVKRLIHWINRGAERAADGRALPDAWAQPCDVRQFKGQVWRDEPVGCQAAEATRRREQQADTPAGRCDARQFCAQGLGSKALTTLVERWDAVLRAIRTPETSQRRACVLVGVDPKTVRCERPPDNPEVRAAMRKIAETRRRFGYRRVGVMLERKGMVMNEKKLYRIYREEGLSVRRRRGRKRARGSRAPMPVPLRPNQRWLLDFLSDTFGASRRFRILAVNDDCCCENLTLIADTSISGARVAREFDALVRIYGKPACIVSDNGTEFTSKAILEWANDNRVEWHRIDPGKPQQNGYILRRGN